MNILVPGYWNCGFLAVRVRAGDNLREEINHPLVKPPLHRDSRLVMDHTHKLLLPYTLRIKPSNSETQEPCPTRS
ncbi:hypothetical protein CA11_45920 [Gimesia maris]|nr:hypothetical protein CA11_45920 [Gimesia maris]